MQALAQYRRDKGDYPEELSLLVPRYLPQIPSTQMIGYPDWIYSKGRNDLDRKPDTYELKINCPSGIFNFDWFIYWPSENYPKRIQDNGVERIRTWAYIHE
ncbi:hypothetical protein ACYOEI_16465 [Singulisphaera rosea]